jgi:hypothetical protein
MFSVNPRIPQEVAGRNPNESFRKYELLSVILERYSLTRERIHTKSIKFFIGQKVMVLGGKELDR